MRTGMEWDKWYHELCLVVAKKSQCLSRKIGAILVRDNSIISTGYNGPPRDVGTCDERWFVDMTMRKKAKLNKFNVVQFNEHYKKHLEGKCPRYIPEMGFKSGEGLDWCVASHAEANVIINAARMGIDTKGTKMFMSCGIPCKNCLGAIINAGVEEIIVTKWKYYDISSEYLLKESGLKCRVFDHLKNSKNNGDY